MKHRLVVLAFLMVMDPAELVAQPASVVVRGFISSSVFVQSGLFGMGNGQASSWSRTPQGATDTAILGADVRNSRISAEVTPTTMGAGFRGGGLVEIDFFGGFNGSSAFSDEQPLPRLRSAYVDVTHGGTRVRVGQAFTPLAGFVPSSPTHMAFPLGFASAGWLGWRHPGVQVTQNLVTTKSGFRAAAHLGTFRGSWQTAAAADHTSAGEAGVPQVEARLDVGAKTWDLFVAAHYDEKDLDGAGASENESLAGKAISLGGRVGIAAIRLQGNAYAGRAVGQQMAHLAQFGDIGGVGAWGQAIVALSPAWSVAAFLGADDPSDRDLIATAAPEMRLYNRTSAASLQWTAGDLTLGGEWKQSRTHWAAAEERWTASSHQVSLSAVLRFSTETRQPLATAATR